MRGAERGRPRMRGGHRRPRVAALRVDDAMSPEARVAIAIKNPGGAAEKTLTLGWVRTGRILSARLPRLAPGSYRFWVSARDRAGWTDLSPAGNRLVVT